MTKIELQLHDDVFRTIKKIKNTGDSGIELVIPQGSVLFDNILNLKLIENQAEGMGVSIQFTTDDEAGNTLISNLEGGAETGYASEQLSEENQGTQGSSKPEEHIQHGLKPRIKIPSIHGVLPKINLDKVKTLLSSIKIKRGSGFLVTGIILAIIALVYIIAGNSIPKAKARVILSSTPLTRSIPVKVKLNSTTDFQASLLKGSSVEAIIESSGEALATGEKLVGEKAKGEVILYNKSSDEITLKKGTELTYSTDNKDYVFLLNSEVSIPGSHQESSDPGSPIIPGEKNSEVTAEDIGSGYNIGKDKSLEVSKYKRSVLEAKSKSSFEGGKADKVKVILETDRTALSKKLQEQALSGVEISLKSKLTSPNKLITGAISSVITKEAYSGKAGDQADKVTLEQTLTVTGLTYSETELNNLLNKLSESLAPQNFSLSKKDWSVKVDVLGNSTSSTLSTSEADLQVTLKTSIVPVVDKDQIKKSLAGKPYKDALKILGGITNVSNYELSVSPGIPFFKNVPKDTSKIELIIENE